MFLPGKFLETQSSFGFHDSPPSSLASFCLFGELPPALRNGLCHRLRTLSLHYGLSTHTTRLSSPPNANDPQPLSLTLTSPLSSGSMFPISYRIFAPVCPHDPSTSQYTTWACYSYLPHLTESSFPNFT